MRPRLLGSLRRASCIALQPMYLDTKSKRLHTKSRFPHGILRVSITDEVSLHIQHVAGCIDPARYPAVREWSGPALACLAVILLYCYDYTYISCCKLVEDR